MKFCLRLDFPIEQLAKALFYVRKNAIWLKYNKQKKNAII